MSFPFTLKRHMMSCVMISSLAIFKYTNYMPTNFPILHLKEIMKLKNGMNMLSVHFIYILEFVCNMKSWSMTHFITLILG